MSGSVVEFQAQIASIMEVLANAAVTEICKVVDDGYAVVHMEMSQSHKENEFLRRKMKLMELQIARFRAERTKLSEGSVQNRFHGIRLLNRHNHRETATTGPTWQSRARLSNRSFGNSSIQRDRQPIDVDQDDVSPSKHMDATSDEQSAETEEGEPDLLIIKDEGEADDQDSRISHPARTVEGSRELTTQPAAATTEDCAFQPRGNIYNNNYNNTAMEVSGSDAILLQSETGTVNQGPQQHTGFEPKAERQSLDTKCDMNGDLNLLRDSLNQVWREVVVNDDGASAAHTKVMDLGSGPVGPETQTSSDIEMRSVGLENHRFSPKSFHSSSEHVIVIDSVSTGQQVDRGFEWGQVATTTTPQDNGTGNKQGVGGFNRNAPMIHPKSMRDNTTLLVAPGFHPTEKNTGIHLDTGNASEANKDSWSSLASFHRHSEIPGRGVQQPVPASLPDGYFRPSATTFSHSSNFASHFRPGTVERPYGCPSCHKKFIHESDLQHHMTIHTRKRAFACMLCEKSFVSPSKLQVHQNVHTGEKPFSCAQCGRRFSHSSNLKRHQKLHH
ncbi:zinc finger and BTB domain-containing protein 20-like isoform X5 [Oncorhynchus mykiss]|uniref:zinc finger and BTB domain-containing protein 20-like isoform X5 n=1 Tax=Oncorhynchus mykiss TaxID=8022 RepID=UPI0018782142|nr:zinc finger and BTB domain-containing protein 20-like isoform X5 [Oncorhynchus mykiss]